MNINYFKNKFCTVFLTQINRNFKEENPGTFPQPLYNYFSGWVEDIDLDNNGIWLIHPTSKCRSFYFFPHIAGITEEEVLNPENAEDAQKILELKKINEEAKKELETENNETLNVDDLEKLNQKLQQS